MTDLRSLPRLLRTTAGLRPDQIWHRLRYRVRRAHWERTSSRIDARYRSRATELALPDWQHAGLSRVATWRCAERSEREALAVAEDALEGRFSFLGREEHFGAEVDWFRPDLDRGTRLWKTLLHEFSYAVDLARAAAATGDDRYASRLFQLARSWRRAASIGARGFALDAWNARAVATRLVHWSVAGSLLGARTDEADLAWLGREIGIHGLFLRDNLELDLRGNHLFRDCVGLVFANTLVGGVPDALRWLERQVADQVLPDGAHEERAPLYHAICTRDLLEVRLLLGASSPDWLDAALARMAGFLEAIALGDGEIPLFGDAWLGEVDTPRLLAEVRRTVTPVEPRATERHSGLVPLSAGPWRLVLRAGDHAPDEQMGHAHADLLSFDASFDARRVVTDTGTLGYDPGPDRQRVRATRSHNTVRIDEREQIEAWGSFRVGRRGRARVHARGVVSLAEGTWCWVSASHDAWVVRGEGPVHHRLLAVSERGILVLDAIPPTSALHRIESSMHEHPDCAAAGVQIAALGATARREAAPLHDRFGRSRPMNAYRVACEARGWVGGWWIAPRADAARVESLRLGVDQVGLQLRDPDLALTWRPRSFDAHEAVSFCSLSNGSAN